jgi:hypothetical protein
MPTNELERLWQRLQQLVIDRMPLSEPPHRSIRRERRDKSATDVRRNPSHGGET